MIVNEKKNIHLGIEEGNFSRDDGFIKMYLQLQSFRLFRKVMMHI
jgi:hypothetical protein